jgi:hypothetical protein
VLATSELFVGHGVDRTDVKRTGQVWTGQNSTGVDLRIVRRFGVVDRAVGWAMQSAVSRIGADRSTDR